MRPINFNPIQTHKDRASLSSRKIVRSRIQIDNGKTKLLSFPESEIKETVTPIGNQ